MDQQTFDQFNKDREYVLAYLRHDPRTFASTLYTERKTGPFWNRQLETFSPYLSLNNAQLCCLIGASSVKVKPNICLISKVNPLAHQGKEAETLLVTTGPLRQPQYFVLKVFEMDRPEVRFFESPVSNISHLGSSPQLKLCLYPNITNLQYLGSDNFTNEYLVGFVLNEVYRRSATSQGPPQVEAQPAAPLQLQIPQGIQRRADGSFDGSGTVELDGAIRFISATICNSGNKRKGTIIMDYADLGDIKNIVKNPLASDFRTTQEFLDQAGNVVRLNSLKPAIVVDICKQVVANFDFLHRQVEFNHGDLKANNILIQSTPSQGNYQGLAWNSAFTVKLADFGKSSLTIADNQNRRIRLFNYSSAADTYLGIFPFRPSLGTQFDQPYYLLDTNTNLSALARIRHMGIPFFYSMDLYTFIISLLLIPEIFYPVMTDNRLRTALFDNLWFQDDYSTVWTRLYNAIHTRKDNSSYSVILDILTGIKLKCQATTILLDGLKTLQ